MNKAINLQTNAINQKAASALVMQDQAPAPAQKKIKINPLKFLVNLWFDLYMIQFQFINYTIYINILYVSKRLVQNKLWNYHLEKLG